MNIVRIELRAYRDSTHTRIELSAYRDSTHMSIEIRNLPHISETYPIFQWRHASYFSGDTQFETYPIFQWRHAKPCQEVLVQLLLICLQCRKHWSRGEGERYWRRARRHGAREPWHCVIHALVQIRDTRASKESPSSLPASSLAPLKRTPFPQYQKN